METALFLDEVNTGYYRATAAWQLLNSMGGKLPGGLGRALRGGGASLNLNVPRITKYNPINPGPLAPGIAEGFRSSTYSEITLDQPITLYRVYGGKAGPAGSWWSFTKPSGPLQAVIDSALDQNWGNTATQVATARIPAGTTIYVGTVAPQRGLVGGGNQVYVPKVDPSWVQR
jgi:hypothetical protein